MREQRMKPIGIHKSVYIAAYIYLTLPPLIFMLGWCRWYIGIPAAALCLFSMIACIRNKKFEENEKLFKNINKWRLFVIAAVIFGWVAMSGIGGYFFQNADHYTRNTIQKILVEYNWPARQGTRGMVYYIGTWLPATLLGKIFGKESTDGFLFLWVFIGISLIYALICIWRKKISLWPLMIIIFFSGLDILGSQITSSPAMAILGTEHLEWWSDGLQYSSMTTQLFWVFNQAVPVWLAMMLLKDEPSTNIAFLCSLLLITSTLPVVGIIPIAIYYIIKNADWYSEGTFGTDWKTVLRNLGGWKHNIGTLSVVFVIGYYLVGNDIFCRTLPVAFPVLLILVAIVLLLLISGLILLKRKNKVAQAAKVCYYITLISGIFFVGSRIFSENGYANSLYNLVYIAFFLLIEVGIYLYLLRAYVPEKALFNIVAVSLIVIPFFTVGISNDFCMRASIPGLFLIMLWCIQTFDTHKWNLRLILLAAALLVGSVTPMHEIRRSISVSRDDFAVVGIEEEKVFEAANFSGITESFFWKNIAKKNNKSSDVKTTDEKETERTQEEK